MEGRDDIAQCYFQNLVSKSWSLDLKVTTLVFMAMIYENKVYPHSFPLSGAPVPSLVLQTTAPVGTQNPRENFTIAEYVNAIYIEVMFQ